MISEKAHLVLASQHAQQLTLSEQEQLLRTLVARATPSGTETVAPKPCNPPRLDTREGGEAV